MKELIGNHQKNDSGAGYDDNVRQEAESHIAGRQKRRELGGMMIRGMKGLRIEDHGKKNRKNPHFHPSSSNHHLFSAPLTPHSTTAPAPTTSDSPPPGEPKPFPATYILSPEGSKQIPAKSRSS